MLVATGPLVTVPLWSPGSLSLRACEIHDKLYLNTHCTLQSRLKKASCIERISWVTRTYC